MRLMTIQCQKCFAICCFLPTSIEVGHQIKEYFRCDPSIFAHFYCSTSWSPSIQEWAMAHTFKYYEGRYIVSHCTTTTYHSDCSTFLATSHRMYSLLTLSGNYIWRSMNFRQSSFINIVNLRCRKSVFCKNIL